ncbi:glycosyltransferase family 2 protein [Devosia sp. WQ 349]|uniref:glycosyltransferase family 2 protein n=1 Tax=Devosia sp. WQ 349K1 TaxID=2800329 RepID=UPI001902F5F3|nr:glycosyltransferase family 2 protein [Devosia sp. WQ 349K1]MBK1795274.1 glycosyltransferase family 2 protein [Devosia sp. WQ 349K1]
MKVVALLQARNEERYLSEWLENIAPVVDAIVAIDDGSMDKTADILSAHPKLAELIKRSPGQPWRERDNHIELIKAGRRHQADWFLCIDADERIELNFGASLPALLKEADVRGVEAFSLRLREMWNDDRTYRVDGIWGQKARYRLFKNNPSHNKFDPRQLHRHWMPLEIVMRLHAVGGQLPYAIYHLRMIDAADRLARYHRYKQLDPTNRFQTENYDYLIDETGLELATIAEGADYKVRS